GLVSATAAGIAVRLDDRHGGVFYHRLRAGPGGRRCLLWPARRLARLPCALAGDRPRSAALVLAGLRRLRHQVPGSAVAAGALSPADGPDHAAAGDRGQRLERLAPLSLAREG